MTRNATESWKRNVDSILRGDRRSIRSVRLGPTPDLLKRYGLAPADLIMSAGKIATARREHPEVPLDIWHTLPDLLADPLAIFPSRRQDGSIIVAIIAYDRDGNPIIVPILPGDDSKPNVILSIYGKSPSASQSGDGWIATQLTLARKYGDPCFEKIGSVDAVPKPESAEAISSSSGPIPVDGSTKPNRNILSLRKNSTKD